MLETIIQTAIENATTDPSDYIAEDDLLHCGHCHEAKQCRLIMNDKEVIVPCLCKCEQERIAREEEERKQRERMSQVRQNKIAGLPMLTMASWTFENDDHRDPKLSDICKRYADKFEDLKGRSVNGLLLYGSVGSGKTYGAVCIANALMDKGYKVTVRSFSALAAEMSSYTDGRMEYMRWLSKQDLLVLDDFGVERNTPFMNELVFNVIDERTTQGKPMIITTNMDIADMTDTQSLQNARVYSRILGSCIPIRVVTKDRRIEDNVYVKRALGLTTTEGK